MHISQWLIRKEVDNIPSSSIICFGEVASDMESSNYYYFRNGVLVPNSDIAHNFQLYY